MERSSFSLRDLIVGSLACLVFISLPLVGCGGFSENQLMQNGTQLRGIQQAMGLFSYDNGTFYPGYTADGTDDFEAVEASATAWGCNALADDDIGKVYAILLTGDYLTPDYIVSPLDTLKPAAASAQSKGKIDNTAYSYALLDMNAKESDRRSEWRQTNNSQGPMVADPSSDIRPLEKVSFRSDVSADGGDSDVDYKGSIAWNDSHVIFETKGLFDAGTLKVGSNRNGQPLNPFKNTANDGAKFIW